MGLYAILAKPYARYISKRIAKNSLKAVHLQQLELFKLIANAFNTQFGRDHSFASINDYESFKQQVPIRDYEQLKPYIDKILKGESNVLWKGKPIYLSTTSGTTSGTKYIPITKESMPNHINTAKYALLCYIARSGNAAFADGKMIFLSGSPVLEKVGGILKGRLSGIVNHHIPNFLRRNQMPSYETNCIDDWEEKVAKIAEETVNKDMRLISGIPPWVQMYFDKLIENTGKKIKDIFPNFSLFVHGGVNFEPYRAKLEASIGKKVDTVETYPASEGFIAYQDRFDEEGLLLNITAGIFFEFVPADEIFDDKPSRLHLGEVELQKNYAIILNTNAGLWGYNIGDTVKFVSLNPYRIIVTGRTKHFISAFGEHVIAEEVERAILDIAKKEAIEIIEFTVIPQVNPAKGLPYHEWFVEFEKEPKDLNSFALKVDSCLQKMNSYYADLIEGKVLKPLEIRIMQKNALIELMKSKGKLGGQNKVPRLSNNRDIASEFEALNLIEK